jgi:hypothetical protein
MDRIQYLVLLLLLAAAAAAAPAPLEPPVDLAVALVLLIPVKAVLVFQAKEIEAVQVLFSLEKDQAAAAALVLLGNQDYRPNPATAVKV